MTPMAAIHRERQMDLHLNLSKHWGSSENDGSLSVLAILLLEKTIGLAGKSMGSKDQLTLRSFRTKPEVSSGHPGLLLKQKFPDFPRAKAYASVPGEDRLCLILPDCQLAWFWVPCGNPPRHSVCFLKRCWDHGEKKFENESWLKWSFNEAILWHRDARIKSLLKCQQLQSPFSRFICCLKQQWPFFSVTNPHCFYRIYVYYISNSLIYI